ncbi:secreted RxLR effector protein 78-like [Bidens hawaiensis]|uniref:secreted RxLR effector protein 78-like n=1 Tax=Bidens hawaiensis TaxID=980011 RepID=UPI0040494999
MDSVILENQTAFLSGRSIIDGPLIINEILSWLKKKKKKGMFLKIDFEKAYDHISWSFLDKVMERMGFPVMWRGWILGIISSAKSSVLVNGSPTFEFKCERGIRQGDPISPFLFIIGMEALSMIFQNAREQRFFEGLQLPNRGPKISNLLFADDALILGE